MLTGFATYDSLAEARPDRVVRALQQLVRLALRVQET
jgi:hypothetical protein